jgi:phosphoribosyl 1,2-cyclic phosphate phosphodiesterase
MKVTVLGCGGSSGVPLADGSPGGFWGVCDPANPKNHRRRVSLLVEEGGLVEEEGLAEKGTFAALIDTSPDLRGQIIDNGIARLDAVLFTHDHADHVHGIDELRALRFRQGAPIGAYMDADTHQILTRRFGYAFRSSADPNSLYPPMLDDHLVEEPFQLGPWPVTPFVQNHGPETSLGYRIGPVAYSTDVKDLDETAFEALAGVRLWVLDCLRDQPHPTHSHTAQSLAWIARVKPERAILIHLNHQIDYEDLRRRCPPGVEPGYDGLTVELD